MNIQIGIVGGDLRYGYLANALARKGFSVAVAALDSPVAHPAFVRREKDVFRLLETSAAVLLPTPVCVEEGRLNAPFWPERIDLGEALDAIPAGTPVLGGAVTAPAREAAEARGVELVDLLKREPLAVANALPTAEGALALAMQETPGTVFGSVCVVVGYGRIGRMLSERLRALGARVTVTARSEEDAAWIVAGGCSFRPTAELREVAPLADVIFNTVPARVIGPETLDAMEPGALIIDLASAPGGVDEKAAAQAGVKVLRALSLPGRVAPRYAGERMAEEAVRALSERGLLL